MKKALFVRKAAACVSAAVLAVSALSACTASTGTNGSTEAVSVAAVEDPATVSGTFEGTAIGQGGEESPVVVKLTLEKGVITDVTAEGPGETEGIGTIALEKLPADIAASNSLSVDTVTGATVTSNAIIEAATMALSKAGLTPGDLAAVDAVKEELPDTYDVDAVVVGAGGAGMVAALTLADEGKNVLILESQDIAGGNSIRSTGGMNAAKTSYQDENEFAEEAGVEAKLKDAKEKYADNKTITELAGTVSKQWESYKADPKGYFDSVELFELDTLIGGKGKNNPELVKALAENSEPAIKWLDSVGAPLTGVGSFGGASVKRIHRPVNAEGKTVAVGTYMIPILEDNLEAKGVDIVFNTRATEIITDESGKAVGVKAKDKDGREITVNAKAVILTTGGFGANMDMVKKYNEKLVGYTTTNASSIQGDGITMAEAIGADLVDMTEIQLHPTVEVNTSALITEGLRGDGAILVNAEGKRFVDEVGTRDAVSAAEVAQTGSYSYLIVDQAMADASAVIQGYISKGYTTKGESYAELAKELGIDEAAFEETMNTWNSYVEAGEDKDFGRTSFAKPLSNAPYYAIKVTAGIHHTMGGLVIDPEARVLNAEGNPIEGLFAAGEVTGGVHGANRLGGNAVADFVIFGRIAGASAAEYIK